MGRFDKTDDDYGFSMVGPDPHRWVQLSHPVHGSNWKPPEGEGFLTGIVAKIAPEPVTVPVYSRFYLPGVEITTKEPATLEKGAPVMVRVEWHGKGRWRVNATTVCEDTGVVCRLCQSYDAEGRPVHFDDDNSVDDMVEAATESIRNTLENSVVGEPITVDDIKKTIESLGFGRMPVRPTKVTLTPGDLETLCPSGQDNMPDGDDG